MECHVMMPVLSIPAAQLSLRQGRGGRTQVFDVLRRRYVTLSPEEWVRQNFTHFLIYSMGYPAPLLANEVTLQFNGMQRRCDTVLYDIHHCPQMIIEYKAPSVSLSQRVFDQISRYNIVLRVPYLIITNGLKHYSLHIDYQTNTYTFLNEIPSYSAL